MTREFRCKAFTFFQESVAGAFAAGTFLLLFLGLLLMISDVGSSTACVVDIGDQKVSISCVEEGVSLPHTRIQMNYGGRDVTRFLLWLLLRNGFPHKSCSMDDTRDLLVLTALKETLCHLRPVLLSTFLNVYSHRSTIGPHYRLL